MGGHRAVAKGKRRMRLAPELAQMSTGLLDCSIYHVTDIGYRFIAKGVPGLLPI